MSRIRTHSARRWSRAVISGAVASAAFAFVGLGSALAQAQPTTTPTPNASTASAATSMALPTAAPTQVAALATPQTSADLRVALDTLFEEHTYLTGNAIAPIIGGDQAQANAAATVLDENTQQLGNLFGSVAGPQAQQTFLQLWRRHIADYVQYAQAGLNHDTATQSAARQDLLSFAQDMDSFVSSNNPDLEPGTLGAGLTMHVQGTLQVIDALEAKDYNTAFNLAKQGADMSAQLGDPLAAAIVEENPSQFSANDQAATQ